MYSKKIINYAVEEYAQYIVVILHGEVDLSCSPQAREKILTELKKGKNLLVDLSAVEYIDSSGVASLVEGFQLARTRNQKFALVGVSKAVMQVLQLARLDKIFTLFDTIEDFK
jgi:anti-sigma B factor antagonist